MLTLIKNKYFPALLVLMAATILSGLLVIFRVHYTGYLMYLFLVWNLFLAWIPLGFAMNANQSKNKYMAAAAFIAWLIFFPNTHYILTDLFHLKLRHGVPLWFDLLLLLVASWTGSMLGFLSLLEIHHLLRKWLSRAKTWLIILGIIALESFGIYIGRCC